MVVIDLMHHAIPQLNDFSAWSEMMQTGLGFLTGNTWGILAQQQFDTDVFAGARGLFNSFVQSGQLWAFLIGLIAGYLIKGFTSYG